MEAETVYRLRDGALDWAEVDNEVVALDSESSQYLGTNRTGALLWRALAEGATVNSLVDKLVDAYAVDRARTNADVERFLQNLRDHDLLTTD